MRTQPIERRTGQKKPSRQLPHGAGVGAEGGGGARARTSESMPRCALQRYRQTLKPPPPLGYGPVACARVPEHTQRIEHHERAFESEAWAVRTHQMAGQTTALSM